MSPLIEGEGGGSKIVQTYKLNIFQAILILSHIVEKVYWPEKLWRLDKACLVKMAAFFTSYLTMTGCHSGHGRGSHLQVAPLPFLYFDIQSLGIFKTLFS